jgi:hypothetical protein
VGLFISKPQYKHRVLDNGTLNHSNTQRATLEIVSFRFDRPRATALKRARAGVGVAVNLSRFRYTHSSRALI